MKNKFFLAALLIASNLYAAEMSVAPYMAQQSHREQTDPYMPLAIKTAAGSREDDLKNGLIPVKNFGDANTKWRPRPGMEIILSPPFEPDGKAYKFSVVLERKDGGLYIGSVNQTSYAFLKIDEDSVVQNGYVFRNKGIASFVGEFIDLIEYNTVAGERRIAPLFQVLYIGRMDPASLY